MVNILSEKITQGAVLLFNNFSELIVLAIVFGLLSLLVKKHHFWPNLKASRHEFIFNIIMMIVNFLLIPFWFYIFAGFIQAYILLPEFTISPSIWHQTPMWISIPLAIFIGDFIGYWRHRIEHSRLLWPSHAMHHSDTQMSWLTLNRFHPINRITTYFLDTLFLTLLGLPPFFIAINNTTRHYYGYFIHADLPWTYGVWGRVFVSPVMHKWHHALKRKAFNANFASIFSIFDQLFGTYYVPGNCDTPLGATHVSGKSVWYQLIYPFKLQAYRRQPATSTTSKSNTESIIVK